MSNVAAIVLAAGKGTRMKSDLDALIQDDTAESLRAQVFSWSETRLQAAWVGGGALGIAMPLVARLGFAVVTAVLVGVLIAGVVIRRRGDTSLTDEGVGAEPTDPAGPAGFSGPAGPS